MKSAFDSVDYKDLLKLHLCSQDLNSRFENHIADVCNAYFTVICGIAALWLLMQYALRVVIEHPMAVGCNQLGLMVPPVKCIVRPITWLPPHSGTIGVSY